MTKIDRSVEILMPAEKIFPMLCWERCPEWYDVFKKVTRTSEIANGVGETVHIVSEVAGMKVEWDGETTESVINQRHSWRSIGGSFKGFGSFLLTPNAAGTDVSMTMDYELPYSILGKLMDKLRFQKAFEKTIDAALNKLKVILEK